MASTGVGRILRAIRESEGRLETSNVGGKICSVLGSPFEDMSKGIKHLSLWLGTPRAAASDGSVCDWH